MDLPRIPRRRPVRCGLAIFTAITLASLSLPGVALAVGPASTNALTADFNRDGRADLAFTRPSSNQVVVLLGVGDGTFGTRHEIPTGPAPGELAVADFNRDGAPDLAVSISGATEVAILLGVGDGTLAAGPSVTLPGLAASVAVGDIDRDGLDDLVVGVRTLAVLFVKGNGDGTFAAPLSLYTVAARPADINIVDIDHNGDLDIAFLVQNRTVVLGENLGALSFAWHVCPLPSQEVCCYPQNVEPFRIVESGPGYSAWGYDPPTQGPHGIIYGTPAYSHAYITNFTPSFYWYFNPYLDAFPVFRPVEITGDGLVDFLLPGTNGFAVFESAPPEAGPYFGDVQLTTPPLLDAAGADLNGDGLRDAIAVCSDGNAYTFLHNGPPGSCCFPYGGTLPYVVTASAGTGGTISPSGALATGTGGTRSFVVTPDAGYRIADLALDGASLGPLATYTLADIRANHTLEATFELDVRTIVASAGLGGAIVPNGSVNVPAGSDQSFAITAVLGCEIADVLVDGVSVGAVAGYTFTNVTAAHTIEASFTCSAVTIEFDVTPDKFTLGEKKMGKVVTGHLTPPEPWHASDIDASSIRLMGTIAIDPEFAPKIEDNDRRLTVKFSRAALLLLLSPGDQVPVYVTGALGSGGFVGQDFVRVKQGKVKHPHATEQLVAGQIYTVQYEPTPDIRTLYVALLHSVDDGENWIVDATNLPNDGIAQWTVPDTPATDVRLAVVEVEDDSDPAGSVVGVLGTSEPFAIVSATTSVETPAGALQLAPVQPTPSAGRARFAYALPGDGTVRLEVFDASGRLVKTLAAGWQVAGRHELTWRGDRDDGGSIGAGLYFVRLRFAESTMVRRVVWAM